MNQVTILSEALYKIVDASYEKGTQDISQIIREIALDALTCIHPVVEPSIVNHVDNVGV
jgi:hypothetical protein